jgi:Fe-S oxidoreductase
MIESIVPPAQAAYGFIPGSVLFPIVRIVGLACLTWILARRVSPLLRGATDVRFNRVPERVMAVLKFWLAQWKQPRYMTAGILHILVFGGFMVLSIHTFSLIIAGSSGPFSIPGLSGWPLHAYETVKDYATTLVFLAVLGMVLRRGILRVPRYAVPEKYGKDRTFDAVVLALLIGLMMAADSLYEASRAAAVAQLGQTAASMPVLSLPWFFRHLLASTSLPTLQGLHQGSYLLHDVSFFLLLCVRPFGLQFHVFTSLFNVYFAKLDRGTVKPVKWGMTDEELDSLKSFGVKKFEDFTWKHMLDFYSCADCGRCSDNCPANAAGRPLSPRFISIKARDLGFAQYPIFGKGRESEPLIGSIYSEDEIWSCTTCGACEEECPLMIEYIDKIVDLRRGMVDDGNVPQSLQKPLKSMESRGNPYGKLEKKRAEWANDKDFRNVCDVKVLDGEAADTLFFVDSITSYNDRFQTVARAVARVLDHVGENFGILGPAEKDSGHEARRFGEESLFIALKEQNTEAIRESGVIRIVTADPHAFNALKNDYKDVPPVEHFSQLVSRHVKSGKLALTRVEDETVKYTYHDPCYLGRHNQVYDEPRLVLDSIPGLDRVEMKKSRDRSFCCGGGGLMLFYEPEEEQRMGVLRVRMAAEAGANVIVTACPFCLVNMEDSIKVAGLEGKMVAVDFAELVEKHLPGKPGDVAETTIQGE